MRICDVFYALIIRFDNTNKDQPPPPFIGTLIIIV